MGFGKIDDMSKWEIVWKEEHRIILEADTEKSALMQWVNLPVSWEPTSRATFNGLVDDLEVNEVGVYVEDYAI